MSAGKRWPLERLSNINLMSVMSTMNTPATCYHVVHETRYDYESHVSLSRQLLHLAPRDAASDCAWQTCDEHRLIITPVPTLQFARIDAFGNPITQIAIEAPHSSLVVRAESLIEVRPRAPAEHDSPAWNSVREALANTIDLQHTILVPRTRRSCGGRLASRQLLGHYTHASPLGS